ncbi:MAG TPA: hypothetical protein VH741_12815, partial [Candidatus Limnocylindrales bacterium]
VRETEISVIDSTTGASSVVSSDPAAAAGLRGRAPYIGAHDGVDYFLTMANSAADQVSSTIWTARDGGIPAALLTYTLPDTPPAQARNEQLRIAADGTLYVVDHYWGRVYVIDDGRAQLLGAVPPAEYGGLLGSRVPNYNYLSAAIDSGGNIHASFRKGLVAEGGDEPTETGVYYVFFARQPVSYSGVALFTEPDCDACAAAREWLAAAGVDFSENPGDLPAAVATSVASAAASAGYPVAVRLGDEPVVTGAAGPAALARLLGKPQPALVETHPFQHAVAPDGLRIGYQPDWTLLLLEQDQPRVIVQRSEGIVAYAPDGAAWTPTPVMTTPTPMPVSQYTVPNGITTSYFPRNPVFPGGSGTEYTTVSRDVPFNTFEKPGDLVLLHRSSEGGGSGRMTYQLWTTESAPTAGADRAVATASQLIPVAVLDLALGDESTVDQVTGELADYVTEQAVVTDEGDRLYRIRVDLRARGETAANGNIVARTIGGSVMVHARGEGGVTDNREISLLLLVENGRLRTFDPTTRAAARDITSEAVHFTGLDEHWLVTNNIGLPNAIACASGPLMLEPYSYRTFTAAEVGAQGLESCLAALEVAPSVLSECESWNDVQLVLAAQTITSLSASLPLIRRENVTNWELAFGSRTATIHRIVTFDHPIGDAPRCAGAMDANSAAVVRISGEFLGAGQPYTPAVDVVEAGTAAALTAPLAQPGTLAWEREWLELEAAVLEGNLRLSVGNESLANLMFLARAGKRLAYQRQLQATRALLHCNNMGIDMAAVSRLLSRTAEIPEALRGTVVCLNDFVLRPQTYWPTYDRRLWAGGEYDVAFIGSVINDSVAANPTLAFLAGATAATNNDYASSLLSHAAALGQRAADPDLAALATDFQLDDYSRLANSAAKEIGGLRGQLLKAALLTSPIARRALRTVADCVGGATPLADLIERTSAESYDGGIPCVDSASGAARQDRYRLLAIGLRGGGFGALFDQAGRDLDLAGALLRHAVAAIDQAEALERAYPAGTTVAAWRGNLPAADRLVIALRQIETTRQQRGRQLTVREMAQTLAGLTECGVGLVMGLFPDGFLMIGAGIAAAFAGPTAAAVGGVLFLGFGVGTTALGAIDLAQAWQQLDRSARWSGACGVVVGTVLTLAGTRATVDVVRAWSPAELRLRGLRRIDPETLPSSGKTAGLTLEEKAEAATPRGGGVAEETPVVAPRQVDPALQAEINRAPEADRAGLLAVAERLRYDEMTPVEQAVMRELLGFQERPGQLTRAVHRMLSE